MKRWPIMLALLLALMVGGCRSQPAKPTEPNLPNPASVYCTEQGGTVELRTAEEGGQYGVCVFQDGSECEEWAFYRGECRPGDNTPGAGVPNPASVHCKEQGGQLELRTTTESGQVGICVFADGSECEEWAFYRGECRPGGK